LSKSKAVQHLQGIIIQDEYGTPNDKLDQAVNQYKILPVLDVCSNGPNAKCVGYFTKEMDALSQEWDLDFFMNPPYSKVDKFMKYAYEQHKKHNVNGLILTYSKTDTRWWHEFVEEKAEVHFIKGRIKFMDEHGNPTKHPAPYPSVWIIYRKK